MNHRPLNNTWVFDSLNGSCSQTITNIACETRRGGYFVESNSTTYQKFSNVVLAGGAPNDNGTITAGFGGTDDLVLSSNVSLAKFPFGIPRMDWAGPYHTQHAIGLGINSTILNALQSASQIRSRVWSMFWGLTGVSAPVQMDGMFLEVTTRLKFKEKIIRKYWVHSTGVAQACLLLFQTCS